MLSNKYGRTLPYVFPQFVVNYMIVGVFVTATQDKMVEQAVELLKQKMLTQPLVIHCQGRYFIKTDNTAIALANCSCFAEAVEYCFMLFFCFFGPLPLGAVYFLYFL